MAQQPSQVQTKDRDIDSIVRYLTTTFNAATGSLDRAVRTKAAGQNTLYKLQTEFAYRLNEVIQGPRGVLQRNIADCNEFIDHAISVADEASASVKPAVTRPRPTKSTTKR